MGYFRVEGISVARACARPEDWQVGETHDGCRAFDRHHHLYADARIAGEPRTNRVSCLTVFAAKVPRFIDLSPSCAFPPQQRGKSAAPYVLIPRPLFNHNKVLGASDSPRWGASQSGFGHGHAIATSSRRDSQRGRCEYEVESLQWQSTVAIKSDPVGSRSTLHPFVQR